MITRIKTILEELPLFLFTIPAFLIVHIELEYQQAVSNNIYWFNIFSLFLVPFIILPVTYFFIRDFRKSCLFTSFVSIFYYFFCDLKDWLHNISPEYFFSRYFFLIPFFSVVLVVLLLYIKRTHSRFTKPYAYINVLFLILILTDGIFVLGFNASKNDTGDQAKPISSAYTTCDSCLKPDIYYLLFDAYPDSSVLKNEFNFDNSAFYSFLTKNGFRIIRNSHSNYNLTPFSIGSTLNLEYLPNLNTQQDFYMKQYLPGLITVYKNQLVPILVKEGYEIINYSIFDIQDHPALIPVFDIWDLDVLFKRHHLIYKIDMDAGFAIRENLGLSTVSPEHQKKIKNRREHTRNINQAFLASLKETHSAPRFSYVHILLPHNPYSFDADGNDAKPATNPEEQRKIFSSHMTYTNKLASSMIENIQTYSKRPFIIVLQGDHGLKFIEPEKQQLQFYNLNAIYFYNKDYQLLNDSLTNVNTFRIILNTFFQKQFPILENKSYFLNYK
jgi:hypothetical protein